MRSGFVSVLAAIERHPRAALGWFLAVHAAIWTALPTLLYRNLPLDLIEALTYGREWQLGYDKLPPLPWWLVEIVYRLSGYEFAYYLLAQAAVVIAFLFIFAMAQPLVGPLRALIALLIIDGLHYFHYTAVKFNHDVIELTFWALAGLSFHRALRTGGPRYWALLGFAIGAAFWAKYFAVVLAAPLALFVLLDRDARPHWRTAGPYLAAAVALAIMAPHLIWLVANDFLPLAYAEARAAPSRGLIDHLQHPAGFVVGQLLFLIPSLVIALPLLRRRQSDPPATDAFDRRIVTLLAFGPALTMVVLSAVSGRGTITLWGYPLWLFLGLWIVIEARPALDRAQFGWVAGIWAFMSLAATGVFIINYAIMPRYDDRYRAVLSPGKVMAEELSRRFRAATGAPLRYVISETWDGGNVGHYAPERPRVLIDGDPQRAPWIDLADLKRHGAIVVWTTITDDPAPMPASYRAAAPNAVMQPPFVIPFYTGELKLHVHWAIVQPQR